MNRDPARISVCICTYRRPEMLGRLLDRLRDRKGAGRIVSEIVVVDNDAAGSARSVAAIPARDSEPPVRYMIEPDKNIARARNMALRGAAGDYIAGIDDDEIPEDGWLESLLSTLEEHGADGALGPVLPDFEIPPPRWIRRGGFFIRKSFPTGEVMRDPKYTRTGNFMIARRIVDENLELFDPQFGRTGGEDVDFFRRMIGKGYRFVWADEARAFESVPPGRMKRTYILRRALLRGVAGANQASLFSFDTLKSIIAIAGYTLLLPLLLFFGHHVFMKILISNCDHSGKVFARLGIRLVRERVG